MINIANSIVPPRGSLRVRADLHRQSGLTLVELMVAMIISAIIAIAAVSSLIVSRNGFTAVDASSQIRDNTRFAVDLIQRLGVQTGYKDITYAVNPRQSPENTNPVPNITGFNNALASATDPQNTTITRPVGSAGEGSDILILRFQPAITIPGSLTADNAMIDCAGNPPGFISADRDDRVVSVLHVALSQGEPSLMCSVVSRTGVWSVQPIVRGVENFQVLYGVNGVVANSAPVGAATATVATNYLRADQMIVPSDPGAVSTNENWRRVHSIRIGMVLRGAIGSSQESISQTLYPFGNAKASSTGSPGSAMSASADVGTIFTTPTDTRLRQVVTFTVHLRNSQRL